MKLNWNLSDSFPNELVVDAYRNPNVDSSTEKFEWGVPDYDKLAQFCIEKFGWNVEKVNEYLQPLKDLDKPSAVTVSDHFKSIEYVDSIVSSISLEAC